MDNFYIYWDCYKGKYLGLYNPNEMREFLNANRLWD